MRKGGNAYVLGTVCAVTRSSLASCFPTHASLLRLPLSQSSHLPLRHPQIIRQVQVRAQQQKPAGPGNHRELQLQGQGGRLGGLPALQDALGRPALHQFTHRCTAYHFIIARPGHLIPLTPVRLHRAADLDHRRDRSRKDTPPHRPKEPETRACTRFQPFNSHGVLIALQAP